MPSARGPVRAGGYVIEKRIQRASLVGHVVEDLVFENVSPSRFRAELVGGWPAPQYKPEGFFVFSGLREGDYTVRITGERLQTATVAVTVPAQTHVFLDSRGDNELVVIARAVDNDDESPAGRKITFDPVILTKQIRAGARVLSEDVAGDPPSTLLAPLDVGEVSVARVENGAGLAQGSIVRVVRDRSIRMNPDPYYIFAAPVTRVVGRVVSKQNPARPLAGARVAVTGVNGAAVTANDVRGVGIFTGVDAGGRSIVLGAEKDISALTNERGDYNLYFSNETLAGYRVTDAAVQALDAAGVPQDVLDVLDGAALKDKLFRGFERFRAALREAMVSEGVGDDKLLKHQPLILAESEAFIRELTLEVTLAGFDPASKLQPINTAQRRVVDFELEGA